MKLCLLLLLLSSVALARFEWRDVVQDVEIQANGDVIVRDTRTLWTDEDFGEAFICIEHNADQSITLLDDSGSLTHATTFPRTQSCESGAQGTEMVIRHPSRVQESRVVFHYRIEGAVDFFSDVVQWYWIILEQEHPLIRGYDLTVTIPAGMAAPFDAYVHRFANLEEPTVLLSPDRQRLSVSFNRIPDGDGVEIRYLMNPDMFSIRGTEPGFERLLRDETAIAGLQRSSRLLRRIRGHYAWGLLGLAFLLWSALGMRRDFVRVGREPNIPSMQYPFEPPSDMPPAAVNVMMHQQFANQGVGNAFHATIMDLARRGYGQFTGKGKKFEMILDLDKPTTDLEPFEIRVLDYLKVAAMGNKKGDPSHLEFKELKEYSQKKASAFQSTWGPEVRRWVEARMGGTLITDESRRANRKWGGWNLLGMVLFAVLAFVGLGWARVAFIVAAVLCVILAVVGAQTLPAWRHEVAREVYGWQGFKRTLRDYTRMKDAPNDFFELWDRYFVYAAAFGVAALFLKNIRKAAPLAGVTEDELMRRGSWMGSSQSFADFGSFSQSITSMSSALNSASASASSGGSSSGGGGGGGGGSSGGR